MSTVVVELSPAQEYERALELVEALQERVREGDESVTPAEIASARELADFARLRMDAAVRREAREDTDRKATALAGLLTEVEGLRREYAALTIGPDSEVVAVIAAALADYRDRAAAADARLSDLLGRLVAEAGVTRQQPKHTDPADPVWIDVSSRLILDGTPVLFTAFHGSSMREALEQLVRAAFIKAGA